MGSPFFVYTLYDHLHSEHVLYSVEEGSSLLIVLFRKRRIKGAKLRLLVFGEFDRNFYGEAYGVIAALAGTVLVRNTLALKCQRIARLGAFLDAYGLLSVDRNDIDVGTECGLHECDRHFAVGIYALTLEDRMGLNTELDIECSVRAATHARLTFVCDREHISGIYTCRDMDL